MKYSEAILDATRSFLSENPSSVVYGLGVTDPKRIFGTTNGLVEQFGPDRVFDIPLAENSMMGVAIGLALSEVSVLFIHQRLDFFLLAMDQLVNSAAKWHMMFGGQSYLPITIRLVVGRGWGQGPTHSQALHSWFAHIPGLKVVMPSNPADAKGLLLQSLNDPNPVIFVEHRWLHNLEGDVPIGKYCVPIGESAVIRQGQELTIVATSLMVMEARHAAEFIQKEYGLEVEIIDLRSVRPIDWGCILKSVKKTKRLLCCDIGHATCSVSSEIIARVSMELGSSMVVNPARIGLPDHATPTSFGLTKDFYPGAREICQAIADMIDVDIETTAFNQTQAYPHDVPGEWFKGPF